MPHVNLQWVDYGSQSLLRKTNQFVGFCETFPVSIEAFHRMQFLFSYCRKTLLLDTVSHFSFPCRRGTYWHVPSVVPPWAADHRQRRCRQQLCQRSLHHQQGTHSPCPGSSPQTCRPVHRPPGVPHLSQFWWRNWIWICFFVDGTSQCWLWEEV